MHCAMSSCHVCRQMLAARLVVFPECWLSICMKEYEQEEDEEGEEEEEEM